MNIPPATITALISLAIGGVSSHFKPILESQKESKNRDTKILTKYAQEISIALKRLVKYEIASRYLDDSIEGKTQISDPYDDVTLAITKHSKYNYRISRRFTMYRHCNNVFFISMVISLIAFIFSLIYTNFNNYIYYACFPIIGIELVAAIIIWFLAGRSEADEEAL